LPLHNYSLELARSWTPPSVLRAADYLGDPDSTLKGPLDTPVRGRSGTVAVWFWRDESSPGQAAATVEMMRPVRNNASDAGPFRRVLPVISDPAFGSEEANTWPEGPGD
jgi:hypothetical protein